jgi:hypothetical protein
LAKPAVRLNIADFDAQPTTSMYEAEQQLRTLVSMSFDSFSSQLGKDK